MNTVLQPRKRAFTLIELLVVVTIIALVAAMVLGAAKSASITKKKVRVDAEKGALVNMIEEYKSKLNFYPPDNYNVANFPNPTLAQYEGFTATNPLLYELTGVLSTNISPNEMGAYVFNNNNNAPVSSKSFLAYFNRQGIANGAGVPDSQPPRPLNFFNPPPATNQYAAYGPKGSDVIYGLTVPVDLYPNQTNWWHYDSSSAQRHNPNSFDLWAEYTIGMKNGALLVITNGNW